MRGAGGKNQPGLKAFRPGYTFIALCVVLLGALVFIVGSVLNFGGDATVTGNGHAGEGAALQLPGAPPGGGARTGRPMAAAFRAAPRAESAAAQGRHLETFYGRRAYPGAPPAIPHPVAQDFAGNGGARPDGGDGQGGAGDCIACHGPGGYTERFAAYAPVTPHPEFENCRQCHVPQQEASGLFKASDWRTVAPPPLGQSALGGSPPRIPHSLQLRGNCVACHGGPGAVPEIATKHPERENCRQCHVPSQSRQDWRRP